MRILDRPERLVKGVSPRADLARQLIIAAFERGIPPVGTMAAIASATGLSRGRVTNLARALELTRPWMQRRKGWAKKIKRKPDLLL